MLLHNIITLKLTLIKCNSVDNNFLTLYAMRHSLQ